MLCKVLGLKMHVRGAALLIGLWIGFPAYSFADTLDDAVAAERRDDCPIALSLYRSLAAKGVVQAYKRLGFFSEIGYCVKRDWPEAAKWYGKASDAGDERATASLSALGRQWRYMYFGKPLDPTVYALVEKAAKGGSTVAQLSLGVMNYPLGDGAFDGTQQSPGVTGNFDEAISWYQRAANQGDFDALVTMAHAYAEGIGVPQDYVEAYKLLNVAAPRGKYADLRNDIIRQRTELAAKMTQTQIAEGQRLAREWKPTR
jgi:uncharacterized protein